MFLKWREGITAIQPQADVFLCSFSFALVVGWSTSITIGADYYLPGAGVDCSIRTINCVEEKNIRVAIAKEQYYYLYIHTTTTSKKEV